MASASPVLSQYLAEGEHLKLQEAHQREQRMLQGGGGLLNESEVVRKAGKDRINEFLRSHACYDLLKQSGKVVVFDASIPIQLAFYALVEHDMQAAPLWDSTQRKFVGLMTVTDFIDILRHYSHRGVPQVDQLAAKSIAEVLSEPEGQRLRQQEFAHVDAEAPLSHAAMKRRGCQ
eukprot:TRINITY_DN2522_c0_g1_i1.p1 TRINITY_DN2522_c0_g1~~TRINITY_DN2522_c0_g1_i1.p1  ORF type:complete len:175 (-),score=44.92 TRINITY_DN2522_c0_g1_i1:149-673(-)